MKLVPAVMAIALLFFGLSFAVFGADGPGKLLRAVFAPIGCLLKSAVLLVVILLGMLLFMGRETGPQVWTPVEPPGSSNSQPVPGHEVLLEEYPVLAQRDVGLYEPAEFADQVDTTLDEPIKHLTCLATVYVMLERGRGVSDTMISAATYDMQRGAINPGYVGPDVTLDALQIVDEIQAGRPVVLHAVGGPLGHHFVLAVGLRQGRDGIWTVQAIDPWLGERIEFSMAEVSPRHPSLPGLTFTMMRSVN